MSDVKKPHFFVYFRSVLSSVAIDKKASKKIFRYLRTLRVTVSLDSTFTFMEKPVHMQVYFDKKGKP